MAPINLVFRDDNIFITGGGGFIGKNVCERLIRKFNQSRINVIDRVHEKPDNLIANYYCSDISRIPTIFNQKFDTVIHLAATNFIPPSMRDPSEYYDNNVIKTKQLLDWCIKMGIENFIFASSSSVYGNVLEEQNILGGLTEEHSQYAKALSPYANTKRICEQMIDDYVNSYPYFRATSLRFFSVVGPGYTKSPPDHVLPILIDSAINKKPFKIHGNDYQTIDGTCVRDFTHVDDVSHAIYKAHTYLINSGDKYKHDIINICTGGGVSVKQLVSHVSKITGLKINVEYDNRRRGDAPALIGCNEKAKKLLAWEPVHNIESIVRDTWAARIKEKLHIHDDTKTLYGE